VKLYIDTNKLTDAPYKESENQIFIFDQSLVFELVQDIKRGNPTCYLVSGYRGAGKSSFIRKVEYDMALDKEIVFVHSSFAKYKSHAYLLRKLIRGLFQAFLEDNNIESFKELKKREINDKDPEEKKVSVMLGDLYGKTLNEIRDSTKQKTEKEKETKTEFDILALVGFVIAIMLSGLSLFNPDSSLNKLLIAIIILMGAVVGSLQKIITIKHAFRKSTLVTKESERKSLYDDEIADYHFYNLLDGLSKKKIRIVFVLDELDKVKEEELNVLINEMKPFLVSGLASFIVVAGQDMFYKYHSAESVDDSILSTLFSRIIHVPLFSIPDFRNLFQNLILPENDLKQPEPESYAAFVDYLIFKSKQVPRKFINLIRQKIFWEADRGYLEIDHSGMSYKTYSGIVQAIQKIDDEQIAVNFSDGTRDFLNMQLYIISERIMGKFGKDSIFTLKDIVEIKDGIKDENGTKENLARFVSGYAELLIEELVSLKIIKEMRALEKAGEKSYQLSRNTKDADPVPERIARDNQVLQQFYDFRNVLNNIYADPKYSHDSQGKVKMFEMISKFSSLKAFRTGLENIDKLKSILDGADVLFAAEDIKTDAVNLLVKNKINFTSLTTQILRFYLLEKLKEGLPNIEIEQRGTLKLDKIGFEFTIKNPIEGQPDIFIDMKYRKADPSIKDLVSQAVSILDDRRRSRLLGHVVMVLFNYDNIDATERNKFRFRQNMEENFSSYIDNVHLMPVGINQLRQLPESIKEIVEPLLYRNIKKFTFRNQKVTPEYPAIDDHYFDEVLDLKKYSYAITIAPPVSLPHWRFGLKFSTTGLFLPISIRHDTNYPVFHLERNTNNAGLLVSYYGQSNVEELGVPTTIAEYKGNPVTVIVRSKGEDAIIDVIDENKSSILSSQRVIPGVHSFGIFAWADNINAFDIEALIIKDDLTLKP